MRSTIPLTVDLDHRRQLVGGEPVIFHCHHYNTFLQRSIQDAVYIDSRPFLVGAAAEVAHHQLANVFADAAVVEVAARKRLAADLYRWAGFGVVDLADLDGDGGTVTSPSSHYAWSWRVKFDRGAGPVCHFAAGWLAGAAAAIFGRPAGSYAVEEVACFATGADGCVFRLVAGAPNYGVYPAVGVGPLSDHQVQPVPPTPVDYDGILAAVGGLDLAGDVDGRIEAFGVYLTRHFANYYNRISFELLRTGERRFGDAGREALEPLLVEAGHVCAFQTLGGIMTSTEWDALIRPSLETPEDWVHGIVAAVNAFGWGRWQVTEVGQDRAVFVIHDDYESVGHLAMYGRSAHPVSYLGLGGVVGIMNLVYVGDIASRPTLDDAFYTRLFRGSPAYLGTQTKALSTGDAYSEFVVERA